MRERDREKEWASESDTDNLDIDTIYRLYRSRSLDHISRYKYRCTYIILYSIYKWVFVLVVGLVLVFVLALVSVLALDIGFWSLGCRF